MKVDCCVDDHTYPGGLPCSGRGDLLFVVRLRRAYFQLLCRRDKIFLKNLDRDHGSAGSQMLGNEINRGLALLREGFDRPA